MSMYNIKVDFVLNGNKYEHHKEIINAIENRDLSTFQTKSSFIIYLLTEGLKSINSGLTTTTGNNINSKSDEPLKEKITKESKEETTEIEYDEYDDTLADFDDEFFENFS